MKNIAFIGLGNMGMPMAENLIKAGFSHVTDVEVDRESSIKILFTLTQTIL